MYVQRVSAVDRHCGRSGDYYIDVAAEVFDSDLTLVAGMTMLVPQQDNYKIFSARVVLDTESKPRGVIMITICSRCEYTVDGESKYKVHENYCSTVPRSNFNPSRVPFMIVTEVELSSIITFDRSPLHITTIYRVPSELIDFIKLPSVQPHNHNMITSIWVLEHWSVTQDVIGVIIVLATQLYHELDYSRYCIERPQGHGYRPSFLQKA